MRSALLWAGLSPLAVTRWLLDEVSWLVRGAVKKLVGKSAFFLLSPLRFLSLPVLFILSSRSLSFLCR